MDSENLVKLLTLLERFVIAQEKTAASQERFATAQEKLIALSEANIKIVKQTSKNLINASQKLSKLENGECPVCYESQKCQGWCHRKTYP